MNHPLEIDSLSIPSGDYEYPIRDFEAPGPYNPHEYNVSRINEVEGRHALEAWVDMRIMSSEAAVVDTDRGAIEQMVYYLTMYIEEHATTGDNKRLQHIALDMKQECQDRLALLDDEGYIAGGVVELQRFANNSPSVAA